VARRRYPKSPCVRGGGRRFAIVGNNRSNNLQGTRLRDRIIALGGSDRVAATRGADCVDGGRGNDQLSGDVGNDRIFGGTGNDRLNGGPGSDQIHGGAGNDTINAAFGQDRIWGDAGNDFINFATAGPAASGSPRTRRTAMLVVLRWLMRAVIERSVISRAVARPARQPSGLGRVGHGRRVGDRRLRVTAEHFLPRSVRRGTRQSPVRDLRTENR